MKNLKSKLLFVFSLTSLFWFLSLRAEDAEVKTDILSPTSSGPEQVEEIEPEKVEEIEPEQVEEIKPEQADKKVSKQKSKSSKNKNEAEKVPKSPEDISQGDVEDTKAVPVIVNSSASIADQLPEGVELVNISFPEPTEITDIIKTVSLWNNKTIIIGDRTISGKVQILSPKDTTKEEAYQIFLEALNSIGLTTVETIDIIKIVKHADAKKENLPTYHGSTWAPKTGEFITQVVPLKYVLAKDVSLTLSRMFPSNSIIAYEPTNTLIVSDTGNQIQRILDILSLLDVRNEQPKIKIVPIKHSDPKTVSTKVQEILKGSNTLASSASYNSFKILTDDRTNSVIIFGPPRTLEDIEKLVKTFDIKVDDPTMDATIHVRPLDYSDAKQLAATLSSLISGSKPGKKYGADLYAGGSAGSSDFSSPSSSSSSLDTASVAALSEGVKISADEATNSLIITGGRAAYNALNVIIRKLDKQRSQVYIEADIIEISSKDNFNFGTSLLGAAGMQGDGEFGSMFGFNGGEGASSLLGSQVLANNANGGSIPEQAIKGITDTFSSDLKIGFLAPKLNVPGIGNIRPGLLINILKEDVNSKVLQTPQILTQNNQDATIVVGEKRSYKTESLNSSTGAIATTIEHENVDVTLQINAKISSYSDYVTLKIDLDANSIAGEGTNGAPEVAKRKTKQQVTVKNNQTVVISGLLSQEESEAFSKIPLLGDIPILGMLFKKTKTRKIQKNLVMFITPHVIHGPGDLAAIYKAKIEERDDFLKKIYGKNIVKSDFYRLMPSHKHGMYNPTERDKIEDKMKDQDKEETLEIMGYTKPTEEKSKSPFKESVERTVPINLQQSSGSSSEVSLPEDMPKEEDTGTMNQ